MSKLTLCSRSIGSLSILLLSTFANSSETAWDSDGTQAYDYREEYLIEAKLHDLNNTPYIAFTLHPFEPHNKCKYSSADESAASPTTFQFDGETYPTHIICIQYEGLSDYFYSLVTFDEDIQKQFIARFAVEMGPVEISYESIGAQLPSSGFTAIYKEKFGLIR